MYPEIYLVASGDLRLSANQTCWPAQRGLEEALSAALQRFGATVRRAHAYDPEKQHGFIDSQRYGMDVFQGIPTNAPVIVAEAVWQYSHHVLAGLFHHRGPILTVANWSGQWPGLVGMLNLNASLAKAGVKYSTLWSSDFKDEYFLSQLKSWLGGKPVEHDATHVRPAAAKLETGAGPEKIGTEIAHELLKTKAIFGIFDEGCMGMYNAIVPDELLHPLGIFKERLSQSALYAAMKLVPESEAQAVRDWLDAKGMKFNLGTDPATELTAEQVLDQCRMYIAALRIADQFGCDAIGIQYQQGLKDLAPASDLVEGLLNNVDRPPVKAMGEDRVLYEGNALPHFNEVDECAGIDALLTNRIWTRLGLEPETTLHDVRYGEDYKGKFTWVFEISGAIPANHLATGYAEAQSDRQPAMFFPMGGGTLKGVSKPGEIVWSRVYVEDGGLKADLGRGTVIDMAADEVKRRWEMTTTQWPIMNVVLHNVSQTQLMGRHKSNHVQVAYASDAATADAALQAKAAAFQELGLEVFFCGC